MKALIITLLGGRVSIAEKHLDSLLEAIFNMDNAHEIEFHIVAYVTSYKNQSLNQLCGKYVSNDFMIFLAKTPYNDTSSTLDFDYDYILSTYLDSFDYFLLLHDDTFVEKELLDFSFESLKNYSVVSFLDSNRSLDYYHRVLIDGVPLSSFRLGTWFFAARSEIWDKRMHGFGCGSFFSKKQLHKLFNFNERISITEDYLWLNGGALLNLSLKLQNESILILDEFFPANDNYHFNAAVNRFIKSKWLCYMDIDQKDEVVKTLTRFQALEAEDRTIALEKFTDLIHKFNHHNLVDNLINEDTLNVLKKINVSATRNIDLIQDSDIENSPSYLHFLSMRNDPNSYSTFIKCIDQVVNAGITKIVIDADSELCLDIIFKSKIEYAKKSRLIVEVIINNVKLDSLRKLCEMDVNSVIIPCDADTSDSWLQEINTIHAQNNSLHIQVITNAKISIRTPLRNINQSGDHFGRYPLLMLDEGRFVYQFINGCKFDFYKNGIFLNSEYEYKLCPFDTKQRIYLGDNNSISIKDFILHDIRRTIILRVEGGAQDILPCHYCPNHIVAN